MSRQLVGHRRLLLRPATARETNRPAGQHRSSTSLSLSDIADVVRLRELALGRASPLIELAGQVFARELVDRGGAEDCRHARRNSKITDRLEWMAAAVSSPEHADHDDELHAVQNEGQRRIEPQAEKQRTLLLGR
jgi:hypothetical protein